MILKFDGWPSKTIGHLFYATSSFVHHFVAICVFKLELQSGNAQSGSNSTIFRAVRVTLKFDVWPWKTIPHFFLKSRQAWEPCSDRRPGSQVSAFQLRMANVSRNISYRVHHIVYRIVSWSGRIVSALHNMTYNNALWSLRMKSIWVRSRKCGCLVTWFCYQLIAKSDNKTAAVSWPDPYTRLYTLTGNSIDCLWRQAMECPLWVIRRLILL